LFERQARRTPDATALVFGEEQLSYAELDRRANRLAHRLIGLGVEPETRVGIAAERSLEMVVGLLGILKAGAAYVPLDPDYPAERLAYMVADSGIDLVLTQSHLRGRIPGLDALQVLALDGMALGTGPDHDPGVPLHGEHLAYVIYTSGSTGRPKGAANRHRSLRNRLAWGQQHQPLDPGDAVLQKTPFSFDISFWEVFWPLSVGARLVLAGPGDHRDPQRIAELVRRHGITTIHFVPSMLQAFMAHGAARSCAGLRRIICSGEALPADLQQRVLAALPQVALLNLYGPTEAAIEVTWWRCREDGLPTVPIGRPVANIRTHVLDAGLDLVPQGVPGELYLGGVGLARGYLGRPGLTAERFVADPFDSEGARLYRTGDLVRWNGEGQLEYLGRIDHQVKIRGFRIELGEVEAQLLAQPGVREAVVVAREGAGGARLVAYITAGGGQLPDAALLKEQLGRTLPDYMVPGAIVVLEGLPLNANGKVDRKALPEPVLDGASQDHERPHGEMEEALARIWCEVLGVERVGRHDNFFELGGHSLLALQLLERVRGQGWAVQVRTLFEQPRLAAFAQALGREPGRPGVVVPRNGIPPGCTALEPSMLTMIELDTQELRRIEAAVPGGAANIQDLYPLAPLQEGILFHHRLHDAEDAYAMRSLLRFDGKERLLAFVEGFSRVVARHDILRTAVLWEGLREPVQVVLRHAEMKVQGLGGEADVQLRRIDVRRAPMIEAVAVRDATPGRWLLHLYSHHLVLDHASLAQIVEEIALIQAGREEALPEPVPFRRFVAQARLGVSRA
ncbi:amino acid adenylation domain-containing protein, partial [Variovorax sp. DT-64]|uniref:amino acid adenylation domain-containing protein n=1 Tax=Variovorax sp. DT-64 TaxID=3396160 RepID=UPI003F19F903